MNVRMMEGLVGASTSVRMSDTSMSVYRQASAEGDTERMKQALKYTGACMEQTAKYQEKLDKGMRAEIKAEREKTKLEQEAAIEKRREERKKTENRTELSYSGETNMVQISNEAKAALANRPVETKSQVNSDPVSYTETGEAVSLVGDEFTVSFSA